MTAARVRIQEIDQSATVQGQEGVYGALVLAAKKGPVDKPFLVTVESQLLKIFTPNNKVEVGFSLGYYSALAFLQKSKKLWVQRIHKQAKFGGVVVRSEDSSFTNHALLTGMLDPTAYVFDSGNDVDAVAEVSDFTAVADVSAALGSKYFTWHKAPLDPAFYGWYRVQNPAVAEVTTVTFSQVGSFYDVSGTAKAVQHYDGANAGHYFWFNVTDGSNVQTAPSLVGTAHQVNILAADTSAQVATKFAAIVDALAGFVAPVPGASIVTVTNAVAGVATDATATGSAAAILVSIQGAAISFTGTDPAPGGTGVQIDIARNDSATTVASTTITALSAHGGGAISGQPTKFRITNAVAGAATNAAAGNSGFTVVISTPGVDQVNDVDEALFIYQSDPGVWGGDVGIKLTTYGTDPDKVKEPGAFLIEVFKSSNTVVPVESWIASRVPGALNGYGQNIYVQDVLAASNLIRAIDNVAVDSSLAPLDQATILYLAGGTDGLAVTDAEYIAGLAPFENKDDLPLTLLMDGGQATSSYGAELEAIVSGRFDSVALLSTPYAAEASNAYIADIIDYRKTDLNLNSSFAALYTPHILIYDKFNDRKIYVSPDGYAAAAVSATASNFELWFPPAGFKRGVLNKVLEPRRKFTSPEMDLLYDNGINPIRFAAGKGIVIWGQKTLLSRPSALNRLNVRLLLVAVEPAIATFFEDFTFDFNDAETRGFVSAGVDTFMSTIQAKRGVYAYSVVCDDSNNDAAVIDANQMVLDLFLKPTRSAEDLVFRVIIQATNA